MVLAAAYAGLRFGELCALRMDRFDALRRSIRVEDNLSEVRSEFIFKAPKSDASRWTVSVPEFFIDELAQRLSMYPDGSGLVFTARARDRSGAPISDGGSGSWPSRLRLASWAARQPDLRERKPQDGVGRLDRDSRYSRFSG